jgi:hypothetical protein
MKTKLQNYSYSMYTEVKFRGDWQRISEVWFNEEKIGLSESKHLINYSEVEDIRN